MVRERTMVDFCEFYSYTSYEVESTRSSYPSLTSSFQIFLLLELAPPVLAAITVWRMMSRPGSVIWIIIVLHSNIVLWSGIQMYGNLHGKFFHQDLSLDNAQHTLLHRPGCFKVREGMFFLKLIYFYKDIGITSLFQFLSVPLST